jgi:hypothetical protein
MAVRVHLVTPKWPVAETLRTCDTEKVGNSKSTSILSRVDVKNPLWAESLLIFGHHEPPGFPEDIQVMMSTRREETTSSGTCRVSALDSMTAQPLAEQLDRHQI